MANASFVKSIGDNTSINAESVGISQSSGGPVSGYPGTTGTGAGKVPSKGPVTDVAPAASVVKGTAKARQGDGDIPAPSKTARK
jgi:outer membrane receptor for monomeric catechols